MRRQTEYSPSRNTLLLESFLSKSYKIRHSYQPKKNLLQNQSISMKQNNKTLESQFIKTNINQTSQEYQNIKQKTKDRIKRIISHKRFDFESEVENNQRNQKRTSDSSLIFLKNIYFDYLNRQIGPSKQKKTLSVLQQKKPSNKSLNVLNQFLNKLPIEQKKSNKRTNSKIRFSKPKIYDKIIQQQVSKTQISRNISVEKMILAHQKINKQPKLVSKPFIRQNKKKIQVTVFMQNLQPWSNHNND